MDRKDKILGCIFGGAIGDAFGNAYENQVAPLDFSRQKKLQFTDDTQLTLATCEAIVATNGVVDPEKIAATFAQWHQQKRITGIGASTLKALAELTHGGHWALVGRKGERAAGNGAAMRIAPLAFFLNPQNFSDRQIIRDVSRITHHNDEAYAGALAVITAIRAALEPIENSQQNLLAKICNVLPDTNVRDRLTQMRGLQSSIGEIAENFGASGFVVESVPFAIYAAQQVFQLGFEQMIREVVLAGGDTDTNASIAGQIAGAMLGYENLPPTMVNQLPDLEFIAQTSHKISHL